MSRGGGVCNPSAPRTERRIGLSRPGGQKPGQQLLEVIPPGLALDAEPADRVRPAVEPPLHLLADPDVLHLDLVCDSDALVDEARGRRGREVVVEDDLAPVRAERL